MRLIALVALALSACAPAFDYQHRLVGVSAEALLRCAGVPAKTYKKDGRSYWRYGAAESGCAANVRFANDAVASITPDEEWTARSERCGALFKPCLAELPLLSASSKGKAPASPKGGAAKGRPRD